MVFPHYILGPNPALISCLPVSSILPYPQELVSNGLFMDEKKGSQIQRSPAKGWMLDMRMKEDFLVLENCFLNFIT